MDVSPLVTAIAWLGAGLLALAGAGKLWVPDSAMATLHSLRLPSGRLAARMVGLGEIAVAVAVLVLGGRLGAGLLAGQYAVLLAVASRQRAKQLECGCFGVIAPVTTRHLALNATMTVTGLVGLLSSPASLAAVAHDAGVIALLAGLLLMSTGVGLLRAVLTEASDHRMLAHTAGAQNGDHTAGGAIA